ncbi:ribosome biogenesis GTPase Der [Chloroflexota bacterium]
MARSIVALIGRQNVGKSTLLNRLAGKRVAIVDDVPGTTRDRVVAHVRVGDNEFTVVDTGGLELGSETAMAGEINEQAGVAIAEADVIAFLVDVRDGLVPVDLEIADRIRKAGKPVVLLANKADNAKYEAGAVDFYELGLGEPLAVSAYHNRGIAEAVDRITALLPAPEPAPDQPGAIKVAIVGRPNVGKSTLLNAALGEERAIVSEVPGTTRDAIDTLVDFEGESVLLIDTAGIKRRGRIGTGVGRYSVIRALKAVERADVALLVLDSEELVTAQDMHIAGYIQQAAKGIIIIVNKWDLVQAEDKAEYDQYIKGQFRFMPYAPLLHVSAKLGRGVKKIMPQVGQIYKERFKRLSTAAVNSVVQDAVAAHSLPRKGNRQLKIFYATQAEVNPPTFVFFANSPQLMHFSYQRYLENRLRKSFGFEGTPLRFVFKSRNEQ